MDLEYRGEMKRMDRDWKKLGPRESDKHWNRVEQALLRPEELSFYPALNRLNTEKKL